jgi:hypothetical protein
MSELDVQLKHSLDRLVRLATDAPLDWDDVGHRARSGRTRLSILAGAALVCLMVGVAAGFGVGPGLWRLVAGTPVSPDRLSSEEKQMFASMSSGKPVLRTEPDSPELKRLTGKVSIRLLATRGDHTFYVIDVHGPRVTQSLAIGRASRAGELFGSMNCSAGHWFPSEEHPIADYSSVRSSRGDPVTRIMRLEGFAADAVTKVGGLEAFVHSFPKRVVELSSPGARAPEHTIGFWIGDRTIVFTATSSTGRRLFVVANRGTLKLPEKNLGDLAFVF